MTGADTTSVTKTELAAELAAIKAEMVTKAELAAELAAIKAEMVTKTELAAELAAIKAEMVTKTELAAFKAEMVTELAAFREEMRGLFYTTWRPDLDCPICLENMPPGEHARTQCGHLFHIDCILPYHETYCRQCPICRREAHPIKQHTVEDRAGQLVDRCPGR